MDERTRWNRAAAGADAPPRHTPDDVYYGPWAPGEAHLNLLGDVTGRVVVDLGCGSGENAVALARAGATVTCIDISPRQSARGQRLAAAYAVSPDWREGDMHDPAVWAGLQAHIILAAYVLPYSATPGALLAQCREALMPGGVLVASMDHPIRACFWDAESEEHIGYPVRDYHDATPLQWRINETPVTYHSRTQADWVELMHRAGLRVTKVVEPSPDPKTVEALWPPDSAIAPLAHIPHTLILVAEKRK